MQDICKAFGPTVALENVSLEVKAGEVHALVGENGAGKSTLMKILSGAQAPDSGAMWLEASAYRPESPRAGRDCGVGMIYQELSLAPHLSLTENIHLGREHTRCGVLAKKEMRRVAVDALRRAGLGAIDPDTPAKSLSNAQAQQVEIARALASGCRLLVLDEPTSSLSGEEVKALFGLIADWKSQGLAMIYISHFLEEVREVADRCTVLCDGQVVRSDQMSALSDQEIVEAMVGREVKELYPRSARQRGDAVLSMQSAAGNLTLHYGEILGISGLIGAGRTELLAALFGLADAEGRDITIKTVRGSRSPAVRWSQGVGMLSEDRKRQGLALSLSVADNLTLSALPAWSRPASREKSASGWIRKMGVKCDRPGVKMHALSGGNQQKTAMARLMHHGADVWLLDEPTRGIDVGAKAKIYEILNELVAPTAPGQSPAAVLMVSSYLPELLGVCDRIAVMRRGQLGEARPVAAWDEHALMKEAIG